MRQWINKHKWIVIILCVLVGIYFLWPIIADDDKGMLDTTTVASSASQSSKEYQEESVGSLVYITGAVQAPGLYKMSQKSTVDDVIKSAGGVLPYADMEAINLADTIHSGDHIHISFNFKGNPESLLRAQKININTATIKELDTLPGIGPAMAKRIDEYRQQKGAFTKIEDIKQVKGIGDGLYKKIHDKISI